MLKKNENNVNEINGNNIYEENGNNKNEKKTEIMLNGKRNKYK